MMKTIVVERRIDSQSIYIPELKELMGKTAEIRITEKSEIETEPVVMDKFFEAIGNIILNQGAIQELRNKSKL